VNFLFLITALINQTFGWDNQGHRIIGLIAGNYIDDTTIKFLRESIELHSQDIPRSIAYHSIWADMRQGDPEYEWSVPMHIANTDKSCSFFDEDRDCPKGVCLVTAIAKFSTIASNPKIKRIDREEAVKFLIHFIADAHQPLHVGFKEDEGGTKIMLQRPFSKHLHQVWDGYIITRYIEAKRKTNNQSTWNYYDLAMKIMNEIDSEYIEKVANQIVPPQDTLDLESLKEYAAEIVSETSGLYTCNIAYKHEPVSVDVVDPIRKKIGTKLISSWIQRGDSLSNEYLDRGLKVVVNQYVRAGIRLGELLDTIACKYFEMKDVGEAKSGKETKSPTSNFFAVLDTDDDPFVDVDISHKEWDTMDDELGTKERKVQKNPITRPIMKGPITRPIMKGQFDESKSTKKYSNEPNKKEISTTKKDRW
jgi:hypothetical protein